MVVQQAVRWLRVAWWAMLVGVVEGLIWLSAMRRLLVPAAAALAVTVFYLAHAQQTSTHPQYILIPQEPAPHAMLIPNATGRGIAVPIPLAHGPLRVHPIAITPAAPLD